MPKVHKTTKTYTTLDQYWTKKELLERLGIKTSPSDQVELNLTNMGVLHVKVVNIEEHTTR